MQLELENPLIETKFLYCHNNTCSSETVTTNQYPSHFTNPQSSLNPNLQAHIKVFSSLLVIFLIPLSFKLLPKG